MGKVRRIHFIGVGGVGMSALARMARWEGYEVSGSDRSFDMGLALPLKVVLEEEGIKIYPQDGSGIREVDEVVASVAVESNIPDIKGAKRRGIPIYRRWEFLNRVAQGRKTLAVAGTNGKSTTIALLSWILVKNDIDPSLVLGAALKGQNEGLGNARRGKSEWFCFEADESDGGLRHYHPYLGVITNITPDHFGRADLQKIFARFAQNCRQVLIKNADCPRSGKLPPASSRTVTFSIKSWADFQAFDLRLEKDRCYFRLLEEKFELPLAGLHNVYNALAAIAAAAELDIPLSRIAASLKDFPGLRRRMEVIFSSSGLVVIDDYAHNPAKIEAALKAARLRGKRVIALYQPHGFAPLRRFREELATTFSRVLRPFDTLILLPVYYAGGTVQAEISSEDLKEEIESRARVEAFSKRSEVLSYLKRSVQKEDVFLVMGARDPTLSDFAREIVKTLHNEEI